MALIAAVPAFADPSIGAKRAQAEQVMSELQGLSDSLERARSQYDAATAKLAQTKHDLRENAYELKVARHNLRTSQRMIRQRLVSLYTTDQDSALEVIFGSKSLDDLITRIDSAKSVTKLDARVAGEVTQFRRAVSEHRRLLAAAKAQEEHLVSVRAAAKESIESKIGEQNRLLASIKGQIAQLQAAERARQLQAAAAARSRLLAARQSQQQDVQDTIVGVSAVAPQSETIVAPPSTHTGVVGIAMSQLGTQYVWGGAAPGGFDCSGLVMWAYAQVGVSLPHSSYALYSMGVPVSRDQLEPGDLVFFDGLGHVGIYIGGGEFIHAPHTGDVVKISSLDEGWYTATYVGARRIL
ncbi:MAG TPA: NlpC/P60 family protein [Gaiellaceae bacterium]|nr:NlpC/P60 family protein [Gaiellaceae bacterium]